MGRMVSKWAILAGALLVAAPQLASQSAAPPSDPHLATIRQYCATCHNDRMKAAGVSYDGLTADTIAARPDVFEKAVRKLRGRLMPPPTSRQPDQREVDALVTWLESKLDAATGAPVAGH